MKIGIFTFTDGRKRVADATKENCMSFQKRIAEWFRSENHEVVEYDDVIWNYDGARRGAGLLDENDCDIAVFNFCVWSYPDLTAQAAIRLDCPILFIGNINPSHPGWVAFFASAGALHEIGIPYGRVLGDISDAKVQEKIRMFLANNEPDARRRGEEAARQLNGMRYGHFDGPSMGMYTGHVDQSQWMAQFSIHVYHRGQLHLWELAKRIEDDRVQAGLNWLEQHCKEIQYDGSKLTPGLTGTLARQVRMYLAMKDFCGEEGIDFCGLTGQLDMTEWPDFCIADLQEALLNDIADWEEEKKKVIICATECDSNGALTMQILHLLCKRPVLFADLRHYHEDRGLFDLVNSGQHAPWLAERSDDYRENWKKVRLMPAMGFYFAAGGASVQFYAKPADIVTFARIVRIRGEFVMHMFTGSFEALSKEDEEELGKQTTYTWPHAYTRFDCGLENFCETFSANHIHAAIGNYIPELIAACQALDIEPVLLR